VDVEIPLAFVDFTHRKNADNRGPAPDLSQNPMLRRIQTEHGGRVFESDWLLDTGAPASIISTKHAIALGLHDAQGRALREPDFTLPLGGDGGEVKPAPGYRIDRLTVKAARGRTLEYRNVHVLVHDVSAETDRAGHITLDGVFGTNLLFPSVSGLGLGLPARFADGPFKRIWIDGPGGRLLLESAVDAARVSR
jgi:hypothetical protein